MKLKLDENLGHAAAELFRAAGHDVETVVGQGLAGATDRDVIVVCHTEQRGLVTLDLDFSNPLVFKPTEYSGIAVLRLPAKPSHDDVLIACQTLLRAVEQDTFGGKLWSVHRCRIREYRPDQADNAEAEE